MLPVLLIVLLACAGLIVMVFLCPSVTVRGTALSVYWAAPMAGAAALLLSGLLSPAEVWAGLTADTAVNPLKILLLFLSMTLMSLFLDCAGFFQNLASRVLGRACASQRILFCSLYLVVSLLTIFTSNDIVVLTFTPFICYFARQSRVDPLPYLICEFIAANTWSMLLMIGNPTNIYLATNGGVSFVQYAAVMALPTALAGTASFAALLFLFRRSLAAPLSGGGEPAPVRDRLSVRLGLAHLVICIAALAASSWLGWPMWQIALACCLSLFLCIFIGLALRRRSFLLLAEPLRRAPWEIIPFILSMFVLVLALEKYGVTAWLCAQFSRGNVLLHYGVASFVCANLINNIPMSVLFSAIFSGMAGTARSAALYAAVAGSNLGAFATPIGALAGILWMGLLKAHGVSLSFGRFVRYGLLISVPAMAGALLGLAVVLH
jgi:arsenical pump membrane protein